MEYGTVIVFKGDLSPDKGIYMQNEIYNPKDYIVINDIAYTTWIVFDEIIGNPKNLFRTIVIDPSISFPKKNLSNVL